MRSDSARTLHAVPPRPIDLCAAASGYTTSHGTLSTSPSCTAPRTPDHLHTRYPIFYLSIESDTHRDHHPSVTQNTPAIRDQTSSPQSSNPTPSSPQHLHPTLHPPHKMRYNSTIVLTIMLVSVFLTAFAVWLYRTCTRAVAAEAFELNYQLDVESGKGAGGA